jgi:hypothetical protein
LKTFFSPGCTVELPSTEPAAVLVGAVVDEVLVEEDEVEDACDVVDVVDDGVVVLVDVEVEVDEEVVVAPAVVVVCPKAGRARPATAAVTPAAAMSRRRWRRLNPCPPSIGKSSLDTFSSPSCSPARAEPASGRQKGIPQGVVRGECARGARPPQTPSPSAGAKPWRSVFSVTVRGSTNCSR